MNRRFIGRVSQIIDERPLGDGDHCDCTLDNGIYSYYFKSNTKLRVGSLCIAYRLNDTLFESVVIESLDQPEFAAFGELEVGEYCVLKDLV